MPKKRPWSKLTKYWQLKVAKAIVTKQTKQTEVATLWREYLKTLKEI